MGTGASSLKTTPYQTPASPANSGGLPTGLPPSPASPPTLTSFPGTSSTFFADVGQVRTTPTGASVNTAATPPPPTTATATDGKTDAKASDHTINCPDLFVAFTVRPEPFHAEFSFASAEAAEKFIKTITIPTEYNQYITQKGKLISITTSETHRASADKTTHSDRCFELYKTVLTAFAINNAYSACMPFISAILSLNKKDDEHAIKIGLTAVMTWWQRIKAESIADKPNFNNVKLKLEDFEPKLHADLRSNKALRAAYDALAASPLADLAITSATHHPHH